MSFSITGQTNISVLQSATVCSLFMFKQPLSVFTLFLFYQTWTYKQTVSDNSDVMMNIVCINVF